MSKNNDLNSKVKFDYKHFLKSTSRLTGVYQMFDIHDQLLYVGKAKNLKNRLSSYFNKQAQSIKTQALVAKIAQIETTLTETEVEALLLEQNLIKLHKPPYNILLRDDKSYPYIQVSQHHEYPRLSFYRGKAKDSKTCYGPYPSTLAVKESLSFMQKIFKVRQCQDSYFKNRTRPCLEYQIERCSGPCVGLISAEEYAEDVSHVQLFLEGRSQELTRALSIEMETASAKLEFEKAAKIRDQIQALRHVQASQVVSNSKGDVDVFAVCLDRGFHSVQLLVIRDGNMLGGRSYVPELPPELGSTESLSEDVILNAFLPQYYSRQQLLGGVPQEILLSHEVVDLSAIEGYLETLYEKKIKISSKVRSHRKSWLEMAIKNARQNVINKVQNKASYNEKFIALNRWLLGAQGNVDNEPSDPERVIHRVECIDISHTGGKEALGAIVVFDESGPLKTDYRKYNIRSTDIGDDIQSMQEVVRRRFEKHDTREGRLPDLFLVDGGKTQVGEVARTLQALNCSSVLVLGIAKGPTRKAGAENYFYVEFSGHGFKLLQLKPPNTGDAELLLQEVRDEAHRFAITGHRSRRKKEFFQSSLEKIPGIGAERRRQLLNHFGGLQGVKQASIEDLAQVKGVSHALATKIYHQLRS